MKIQNLKHKVYAAGRRFRPCFIATLGAAFLLLGGCSGEAQESSAQTEDVSAVVDYSCISHPESEKKIYVILKNYSGDYWEKVKDGVAQAAEEMDAAVYMGGIDNETDIDGQIELIDQAVEAGAAGILLAPANSNSLMESCEKVSDADIPLVLIDSSINSSDFDACYMTDSMDAGKMAAEAMLDMLKKTGNSTEEPLEVGILLSSDTSQAMVNRVSGFLEYWANYAPEDWEINEDIRINGGDVKRAQEDATKLLKENESIRGFFGCNNTSTVGIANALLKQERTDVVMVGFDLAEETRELLENPAYNGVTLLQKQDQMGYQGMLALDALMRGEASGQRYFDTGVVLIDADYLRENDVS